MCEKDTQQSGSKNTRQKSLILECLKKNSGLHVTVDEISMQLAEQNTPVSIATIYRNLSTLEKNNAVKKYILSDNAPACYQFIDEVTECHEHYHFMCQACGQIVHFEDDALKKALCNLKTSCGFVLDGNKTVFYGTCKGCLSFTIAETLC